MTINILTFIMALLFLLSSFFCILPDSMATSVAKVSIKVIDESEKAIEGARIGVGFRIYSNWSSRSVEKNGLSDVRGYFTISATTEACSILRLKP